MTRDSAGSETTTYRIDETGVRRIFERELVPHLPERAAERAPAEGGLTDRPSAQRATPWQFSSLA